MPVGFIYSPDFCFLVRSCEQVLIRIWIQVFTDMSHISGCCYVGNQYSVKFSNRIYILSGNIWMRHCCLVALGFSLSVDIYNAHVTSSCKCCYWFIDFRLVDQSCFV